MKKRKLEFKKSYKNVFAYLKDSMNYFYAVMIVFFGFFLIGLFLPTPDALRTLLLNFIQELLAKTQNLSYPGLMGFIFFNNVESSFLGMIYGIVLGIFPVFTAALNGYLLGFVSAETVKSSGPFILWRILPHGIFELPALFISLGLGIRIGSFLFQKEKWKTLKKDLMSSFETFILVVIPLLIIAAIIESTLIFFLG